MTKLIVNADDFGYCESVNLGIIECYKNGVVRSTTLMAGMPGIDHAIKLLKENPGLIAGVHMTLTCGEPILKNHKTLVDENNRFYKKIDQEFIDNIDHEELFNEWCAQIDSVISKGIELSHLDSHHHVHGIKEIYDVVLRIYQKYNLPFRNAFRHEAVEVVDKVDFIGSFFLEGVSEDYFLKNQEEFLKYDLVEIMSHPGYMSDFLACSTSYATQRENEIKVLTSNKMKESLEELGIVLTNYKDR